MAKVIRKAAPVVSQVVTKKAAPVTAPAPVTETAPKVTAPAPINTSALSEQLKDLVASCNSIAMKQVDFARSDAETRKEIMNLAGKISTLERSFTSLFNRVTEAVNTFTKTAPKVTAPKVTAPAPVTAPKVTAPVTETAPAPKEKGAPPLWLRAAKAHGIDPTDARAFLAQAVRILREEGEVDTDLLYKETFEGPIIGEFVQAIDHRLAQIDLE